VSVLGLIASLLNLYAFLILIYVILSWFVAGGGVGGMYDVYRTLAAICEPYLSLFRRIVPPISLGSGGVDFSPLLALIVLQLVAGFIGGRG